MPILGGFRVLKREYADKNKRGQINILLIRLATGNKVLNQHDKALLWI